MMPIFLSAFVIAMFFARKLIFDRFPQMSQKLKLRKFKMSQKLASLFSFLVVGFYTLLISTLVQPFNCTKQFDGTLTMTKAPSNKCFDSVWNQNLPAVIFFILLYGISIPLIMIWIFYKNRDNIFNADFLVRYSSLTAPYRPKFFYFEIVIMLKRALFAVMNDFLSVTSYTARYFTAVGTLLFFFWIGILAMPYQDRNLNLLSSS
jgi:hypothetical protein